MKTTFVRDVQIPTCRLPLAACRRWRSRLSFTLIELLVVMAIILLLAGLLFPAHKATTERARRVRAQAEVKQLELAWKSVLSDYRSWPAGIQAWTEMKKPAVDFLGGGPGTLNNLQIKYMEFDGKITNNAGDCVDPWCRSGTGHVYQLRLGVNSVEPHPGLVLPRDVAVWSRGADDKDTTVADQQDDVVSWK